MSGTLHRLTAFTTTSEGGNPAGVWIGDDFPSRDDMLRIARDVGFSETAFIVPRTGTRRTVRYYSPQAEVTFCGHATIAAGVHLGSIDGEGEYVFDTLAGPVTVTTYMRDGLPEAALTSVEPKHAEPSSELLESALASLGWDAAELDRRIPPALAFAGAWHLVLAAASLDRLQRLDYDFDSLRSLMLGADLTTVQLIWRESTDVFHARDPFPVGGVVEDPATGAAAAALGGYLRNAGLIETPATILIRQGEAMGRPSRLTVRIPREGGIVVSGHAVPLEPQSQVARAGPGQ